MTVEIEASSDQRFEGIAATSESDEISAPAGYTFESIVPSVIEDTIGE